MKKTETRLVGGCNAQEYSTIKTHMSNPDNYNFPPMTPMDPFCLIKEKEFRERKAGVHDEES